MATVPQCRKAVDQLVAMLSSVSPELRARHVPERTIACRLSDLDRWFVGELDPDGVHNVVETKADGPEAEEPEADVRVVMNTKEVEKRGKRGNNKEKIIKKLEKRKG